MKNILIIYRALSSGSFQYAGMEKMLLWLGNTLADLGHTVTFCTLYDTERCVKYSNKVKSIELGISYSNSFIRRNLDTFYHGFKRIHKFLIHNNFDYVINFGDISFFLALLLRRRLTFKLITSERGDPYNYSSFLDRLKQRFLYKSDYLVFQTDGARNFYSNINPERTFIIPNPIVIPDKQWKQENTKKSIAYVGRLDFKQKRIDVLLEAFSKVSCFHPDYKLDIYGSGDIVQLKNIIKEKSLMKSVVIHGAVNDVGDRLLLSEMFILTSDFEGIPNSLLEAMALGLPVISTDCSPGGAAMLIRNMENGILVNRGDVESLVSSIKYLIENKENAKILGINARLSMTSFTPQQIINLWHEIINK